MPVTVAVPNNVGFGEVLSNTCTVEPASPAPNEPLNFKPVLSFVMLSVLELPVSVVGSKSGAVEVGGTLSIVTVKAGETPALPAVSKVCAVMLYVPAASTLEVIAQVPVAVEVVLPICVVPANNLTNTLAGAVPVNFGAVLLVMLSPSTPVSVDGSKTGFPGAVGGTVSIVNAAEGPELGLTLFAASVAVAVNT